MYCSQCGAKAAGKFCSDCGAPLMSVVREVEPAAADVLVDWSQEVDYEALLRVPEVRKRIARCAAQSKKRMTGEEFLDKYGSELGKLSGIPLPMAPLAHWAQEIGARMGLKTSKSRSQTFAAPPGEVIVALLCSLAREGRALRNVDQRSDGCVLLAELPSDLFALAGDLVIAVSRHGGGTRVEAHTDIQGQYFDWGKSTRCLEQLFGELASATAA